MIIEINMHINIDINLNKKKKYNIFVLSEKKVKSEYNKKLFAAFGIKNFYYLDLKKIDYIFIKSLYKYNKEFMYS